MVNPYKQKQQDAAKDREPRLDPLVAKSLGEKRREPRADVSPDWNATTPVWVLQHMDIEGPYGWKSLTKELLWELHGRLCSIEKMTWGEIDNKANHASHRLYHKIPVAQLVPEARKRLGELKIPAEEIHRFSLKAKPRIWGFRVQRTFEVLWFDPEHEVCPAPLRNT